MSIKLETRFDDLFSTTSFGGGGGGGGGSRRRSNWYANKNHPRHQTIKGPSKREQCAVGAAVVAAASQVPHTLAKGASVVAAGALAYACSED